MASLSEAQPNDGPGRSRQDRACVSKVMIVVSNGSRHFSNGRQLPATRLGSAVRLRGDVTVPDKRSEPPPLCWSHRLVSWLQGFRGVIASLIDSIVLASNSLITSC